MNTNPLLVGVTTFCISVASQNVEPAPVDSPRAHTFRGDSGRQECTIRVAPSVLSASVDFEGRSTPVRADTGRVLGLREAAEELEAYTVLAKEESHRLSFNPDDCPLF